MDARGEDDDRAGGHEHHHNKQEQEEQQQEQEHQEQEQAGQGAYVPVLYASQTGTAQDTAGHVSRTLIRHHLSSAAIAMDAFHVGRLLELPVVIFVVATSGQGEAPDNMKKTWRFLLRKSLPPDSLQHLHFAVFGLGDSSYPKFNFVGKKLFKRLLSLGATPLTPIGLADDQHPLGVDGALMPWIETLLTAIRPLFPQPLSRPPIPGDKLLPPVANVIQLSADEHATLTYQQQQQQPFERPHNEAAPSRRTPARVPIKLNQRMTPEDHFQDVRHVVFDVSSANLPYAPGDVLYVMPENTSESVDAILDWFGVDGAMLVRVQVDDEAVATSLPALPDRLSFRDLLTHYLDIQAVPKRYFFEILASFAADEMQSEKLREFTAAEGQEARYDYVNRMKRTAIEILRDFLSAKGRVPVAYAADMFGFMQPRAFSICLQSAGLNTKTFLHAGEIHTAVAIVNYRTRMATPRRGVYTNWLKTLQPDTMFVFGNRNAAADFLYGDEWRALEHRGLLTLVLAFSRDQEHKVYVQHKMREHAGAIYSAIARGAYILLAGSSGNMPKQVREAFVDIIQQEGGKTAKEAEAMVKDMERTGRYTCETWD
ncbi:NADPH dependent diflavin oxidoreductase 1 [Salpingoeca rosetta]|uniref:NADPH dependent diflavin oxidoreductase 1 n=1 Tax=Salpingoeca rosetta (strain ATCC 50818 / BSB-021) TaxID=946362 RepID=F2UIL7_SALR5|nr:NADPH dependent diflavin oxidoreductase 1 [Salpingoeca rosetta]EGD77066.1 NADPH dependent diflavin oxidoreductase 1 [Salpingoeca rosetta]|eukprot:XP_004990906.1 NADPH dependent diflavin oxidoreductase 1 [Salpingoeca rosetta]